jgi:outer membrane receptor for ferrienterochelin and colicins
MKNLSGFRPSGALVAALFTLVASLGWAQPSVDLAGEADLHFNRGAAAYRSGNYEQALEHLLLSNRLVPNRNVAFNIGLCYEKLGNFNEAFRYYDDVRQIETDPEALAFARAAVERILPRLALVRVETNPPGALIYFDRIDLGSRGLSPRSFALPPGEHQVLVQLEGHAPAESEKVNLLIGAEKKVELTLPLIVGRLELTGDPPGATVQLDDVVEPIGTLPGTFELRPGPHVLTLSAPGRRPQRLPITIEANKLHQASIELPGLTGSLVVDTGEPGALIEIEGLARGFTPAVLRDVPVGRQRVRISRQGFRAVEQEVTVLVDGEVRIEADLRPANEVVGASRRAEAVEDAPASVTLISGQEIRAFGYETLAEALAGNRGIFASDDLTGLQLGIRGFSRAGDYGSRQLLTLDGHTLNENLLGSSAVGRNFACDLGDVQQIELIRGPGSALYGSNAFFGVVNVVTAGPGQAEGAHVEVAHGGARLLRGRLGVSGTLGATGGFWASGQALMSQGQDYLLTEFEGGADRESKDIDESVAATLAARAWFGKLTLQGQYTFWDKRVATGSYGTLFGDERNKEIQNRGFIEVRHTLQLGEEHQLTTRLFLDGYFFVGGYPYEEPTGLVEDTISGIWGGGELRLQGGGGRFRYTAGTEASNYLSASFTSEDATTRYLDESPELYVISAYGVLDWRPISAFTLNGGGRLDYFSNVESSTSFSPRLTAILRPSPADTLKLIGGRSFRAPSPYELRYNDGGSTWIASDDLEPETILTAEAEYTRALPQQFQLVGSAYYNRISNLIGLPTVVVDGVELLQFNNEDETVHTLGAEIEARRDWRRGLFFAASYSFQRTRVGDLGGEERLSNSPVHLFSAKLATPLSHTGLILANKLRLESPRLTNAGDETQVAAIWDMTLSGAFMDEHLQAGIGLRNLLDWRHDQAGGEELSFDRVPQPGRTLWASLRGSY